MNKNTPKIKTEMQGSRNDFIKFILKHTHAHVEKEIISN